MDSEIAVMLISFISGRIGGIATAALAGVITLTIFWIFLKRSSCRGSDILVVGPSDAGKTAIFSTLAFESTPPSHTSMQTNTATLSPTLAAVPTLANANVVDVPGHPRIRARFSDFMSDAKAIIFVVDASTITRNGAAVAEHLHMILHAITSLPPSQITPPLIIHAHKSDLLVVRSNTPSSSVGTKSQARQLAKQRTKIILERELEKRRKTASTGVNVEGLGAVGSTGADSEADPLATGAGLECSGKDGVFSFSNWEGGDIEFSGGWVDVVRDDGIAGGEKEEIPESGENGLSELTAWLEGLP